MTTPRPILCLLLVLSCSAPAVAGIDAPGRSSAVATDAPGTATADSRGVAPVDGSTANGTASPRAVYTVAFCNWTGNVATFEIEVAFRGLNGSETYGVWLRSWQRLTVLNTTGLDPHAQSERRAWTLGGGDADASMTLLLRTNRTDSIAGRPRIELDVLDVVRFGVRAEDEVRNRQFQFEGAAVRAGSRVYFGNATIDRVAAAGRRIPVVTPVGVDPRLTPRRIARAIDRVHRSFDVPPAPETVSIWYAPHIESAGRLDPVGTGGYDTITLEPAARPETVRHEYVHIVQRYRAVENTTWFTEGSAEYLAHLAAFRTNRSTFEAFYDQIDAGSVNATNDLLNGSDDPGHYTVGERTVAALDLRIRRTTNGTASVVDVVLHLNRRSGERATATDLYAAVEATATPAVSAWLRHTLQNGTVPAIPSPLGVKTALARSRPNADFDDDGLPNAAEARVGTDPFVADTDGDDLVDGKEVRRGLDPTAADTDGDGLGDAADARPRTSTLGATIQWAGSLVLVFDVLSLWITAGVLVSRGVDRAIGIVPERIASLSLRRLGLVQVVVGLLGVAIVAIGRLLP